MAEITVTHLLWVCDECMFVHANGEGDPDRPEDLPAAWALWVGETQLLAMGGEHVEGCENGPESPNRGEQDCECETHEFRTSSCGGCGDDHHGRRHAFSVFDR